IQKALKEAILTLPAEEYDWFNIREESAGRVSSRGESSQAASADGDPLILRETNGETEPATPIEQKQFFEYPGPLHNVRISPASAVVAVNETKNLRAIPRDRSQRLVEENLTFQWQIVEGEGQLEDDSAEIATFHAPAEPGLTRIRLTVTQNDISCDA